MTTAYTSPGMIRHLIITGEHERVQVDWADMESIDALFRVKATFPNRLYLVDEMAEAGPVTDNDPTNWVTVLADVSDLDPLDAWSYHILRDFGWYESLGYDEYNLWIEQISVDDCPGGCEDEIS